MARITPYQQDQLASSNVGTTGVDTSGQTLANAIGASTDAAAGLSVAVDRAAIAKNQQALSNSLNDLAAGVRTRQAQLAYAKQMRDRLNDGLNSDYHAANIGFSLDDLSNKIQNDYRDNPYGAAKEFTAQAESVVQDYMIKNRLDENLVVKEAVQKAALSRIGSERKALGNFEASQAAKNATAKMEYLSDNLVVRAGNTGGDFEKFWQGINSVDDMQNSYVAAYGPAKAQTMMAQTKEKAAKNFLESVIEQAPDQVQKVIGSGAFDTILDAKTRNAYLKDVQDYKKAIQVKADQESERQERIDQLNIVRIASDANTEENDPKVTLSVRRKLAGMLEAEKAKPLEQQSASTIKLLDSKINTMDTQMRTIENDTKRDQRELQALASASRAAAAAERSAAAFERAEKRRAALDVYNSDKGIAMRTELQKLFKSFAPTNAKKLDKAHEEQLVSQATKLLTEAHDKGYLTLPGEKDDDFSNKLGLLQAKSEKLKTGKTNEGLLGLWTQATKGATDLVQSVFNPHNDPKKEDETHNRYNTLLNQGITAFEAQKGRKPTAQEVEKLRQLTEKKMILSGIK
jgi:hypothetical protein